MPPRRKTQTAVQEPPAPSVDLDTLFRKQSKARVVAERLLTGKPQTRAQLAEGLDLSLTTVPRVVDALTEAGVRIERTTDRTRQAVFHVIGSAAETVRDPEHGQVIATFSHTGGVDLVSRITKAEVLGGRVWIEYVSTRNDRKFRAAVVSADGTLNIPTSLLSGDAKLVSIVVFEDGTLGYRFGDDRSSALLCNHQEM